MGILILVSGSVQADFKPIPRPIGSAPPVHIFPKEIPCVDALKTYFDWISRVTRAPEDQRGIRLILMFNQQKNPRQPGLDQNQNLAGYSSGELTYQGGSLVGDVNSYFSDRTYCNSTGGGFCVDSHPFSPAARDLANITISPEGKMTTVLKSWGNPNSIDDLVCMDNGVFYVPPKFGQSSISVITLQKVGYQSPR